MTLCMLWHREDAEWAPKRANHIKVLQNKDSKKLKVCTDLKLFLLCQKTVLIQRETVSHSITCSMCAFQSFMHSGFWAGPIFHTHPHLQHSPHCLSKQDCTGSVWHLCVHMFYMHPCSVSVCSLYFRAISQSVTWDTCLNLFSFTLSTFQCSAVGPYHRSRLAEMCTGVWGTCLGHQSPLIRAKRHLWVPLEGIGFGEPGF